MQKQRQVICFNENVFFFLSVICTSYIFWKITLECSQFSFLFLICPQVLTKMSDQRVQGKLAYDWMVTLLEEKHFLKVEKNKKKKQFSTKGSEGGRWREITFLLGENSIFPCVLFNFWWVVLSFCAFFCGFWLQHFVANLLFAF